MARLYRKVDDDRPAIADTLPDSADLANADSVYLLLEHGRTATLVVNAQATITDAAAGEVEYELADGDLNRDGTHIGEWRVTYPDGDDSWFPKTSEGFRISVSDGINRDGNVEASAASRAGPLDTYEFNEQATDPDPPAADDWALFFRDDGSLYKIDENGSVSQVGCGGGGTANIAIEDDGTEILGAVSTIDFAGSDFGVTNPTGDEAQVVLTSDSLTVTAGDGLKNGGSVALGGSTTVDIEPGDFAGAGLADDGADNLTVDTADEGTITASGGSSPAADVTVDTSLSQTGAYDVLLYVDADPAFNADYQFNYDHAHFWDDSTSTLKIDFTVNWDIDPGAGNDVTLRWEVIRR